MSERERDERAPGPHLIKDGRCTRCGRVSGGEGWGPLCFAPLEPEAPQSGAQAQDDDESN